MKQVQSHLIVWHELPGCHFIQPSPRQSHKPASNTRGVLCSRVLEITQHSIFQSCSISWCQQVSASHCMLTTCDSSAQ